MVDVVGQASASENFWKVIKRDYVVLVEKEERCGADEWRSATLGDLIEIKHGFAFKGHSINEKQCGDVLLTPGNFAMGGGFKNDKFKYYDGSVLEEFVLHEGDLLVTMTDLSKQSDTLGYPAFVPERKDGRRYLHNQRLGKVTVKDNLEVTTRYLYYVMCDTEYRHEVLASATGTTVKHTSPGRIKQFRFQLPPLPEQRAIAHILGTLDDKIELNRRINETLEAMARALFKSWFVDFDPVRAKMEGRDTGLPKHIADLFPDRLVDSELGEIPAGWTVFLLNELADHHTNSIAPSSCPSTEYEHLSIPAYDAGQMPAIDHGEDIKSNKTIVPADAVLLSKLNPEISRVWMPDVSKGRLQICSTEFLAFTPQNPANRTLLFSLFTDSRFGTMLESMVTGTSKSHQRVPSTALKKREVLSGRPELFNSFDKLAAPMLARVIRNRAESHTLAALRDALLVKLMSGELKTGKV